MSFCLIFSPSAFGPSYVFFFCDGPCVVERSHQLEDDDFFLRPKNDLNTPTNGGLVGWRNLIVIWPYGSSVRKIE